MWACKYGQYCSVEFSNLANIPINVRYNLSSALRKIVRLIQLDKV